MDLLIPKRTGRRKTYQITEVLSERLSLDLKGISFQTITDDHDYITQNNRTWTRTLILELSLLLKSPEIL